MSLFRSAKHNWRAFGRLSARSRRVLIAAALLLPITAIALRVMGVRRCRAVLASAVAAPSDAGIGQGDLASTTARLVTIAVEHSPWRVGCLHEALVLWFLLRWDGIASEVRLGVRKADGGIEAHAWVTAAGRPVLAADSFTAFPRAL